MYVPLARQRSLGRVIDQLMHGFDQREVRERIGQDLLRVMRADYYGSYVWDPERRVFDDRVAINMDPANLARYEAYYQFHDPITFKLQRRRNATRVTEIMPRAEFLKTEFYNDFLRRDGLYWGINLYAYDGPRNVGDLRVWRSRSRSDFDREDVAVLQLVKPFFTLAMRSLREAPAPEGPRHTPRESAIARLLCEGQRDEQIALALGIAFSTVRTHLGNLFEKYGVGSRTALVARLLGGGGIPQK